MAIAQTSLLTTDNVFCTLFDSNYLDKGIVLYESMCRHIDDFVLFVFAFDSLTAEVLDALEYERLIVVRLDEFETPELKKVKKERTAAEYCWTCTPWTIRYVLDCYQTGICTYIDADMMFFSSPEFVFQEMRSEGCSTIITPHRFPTLKKQEQGRKTVGEYCVEFNTFLNDVNGRKALDWWCDKCLEWCYYAIPGTTEWYGDQKYLNVFPEKFDGVFICSHLGIGLAPWNVSQVEASSTDDEHPCVREKGSSVEYPVVVYHFAGIKYLTKTCVNVCSEIKDKTLHRQLYDPYMMHINGARERLLSDFNIAIKVEKRVVTANPIMGFYQKYVLPLKHFRRFSDLYQIRGLK